MLGATFCYWTTLEVLLACAIHVNYFKCKCVLNMYNTLVDSMATELPRIETEHDCYMHTCVQLCTVHHYAKLMTLSGFQCSQHC